MVLHTIIYRQAFRRRSDGAMRSIVSASRAYDTIMLGYVDRSIDSWSPLLSQRVTSTKCDSTQSHCIRGLRFYIHELSCVGKMRSNVNSLNWRREGETVMSTIAHWKTSHSVKLLRMQDLLPISVKRTLSSDDHQRLKTVPTTKGMSTEAKNSEDNQQGKNMDSLQQQQQPLQFTLVDRLPHTVQSYGRLIRLDKPWGSMLLMWPCFWSTALAAPFGSFPDPKLLGLFATGSFVMRGAGCIINDMWDAKYDREVERTKTRPLASGELTMKQASTFLASQLALGLGVLMSLPHTAYCFQLGMASMPLVIAYPLMKRYTNWPQLVLGMTFNWGAIMGWAAVHGSLDLNAVLPLYLSGVTWTVVYDTLYAHQDKLDDAKLGLKSTALHFGENTKFILHGFAALTLCGWSLAGYGSGITSPFYFIGCGLAWSHLAWQIVTADLDDPPNLAQRFKSNQQLGAIVFVSCVAGNFAMG